MSDAPARNGSLIGRVRDLVETFVQTDLVRLRIEREGEEFEIRRPGVPGSAIPIEPSAPVPTAGRNVESVRADLVGIFHFSRPAVSEGDMVEGDRELGYVEALGIRNPIRSHGAGRVVAVLVVEGEPVDYGRPLFEVDRGSHS